MGNPAQDQGTTVNSVAPNSADTLYYDSVSGQYYPSIPTSYGKGVDSKVDPQTFIKLTGQNAKPQHVPTINELFPLMSLLASIPQTSGNNQFDVNGSSGVGRFLGNGALLGSSNYPAQPYPQSILSIPTSNGNVGNTGIPAK
jgi:hypothetical protein